MTYQQIIGVSSNTNMTMQNNTAYKSKFHHDGSVTLWNVYQQRWQRIRASRISDEILASLSRGERSRVARMAKS